MIETTVSSAAVIGDHISVDYIRSRQEGHQAITTHRPCVMHSTCQHKTATTASINQVFLLQEVVVIRSDRGSR